MPEKTVAQKMLIKDGHKVLFVKAPKDVEKLLGGLPRGVTVAKSARQPADVVVFFAQDRRALEAELPQLRKAVAPQGSLWVAYHKGTSGVKTDIHRDTIHAYAMTVSLVGVALISVDDDWSAMRFKLA